MISILRFETSNWLSRVADFCIILHVLEIYYVPENWRCGYLLFFLPRKLCKWSNYFLKFLSHSLMVPWPDWLVHTLSLPKFLFFRGLLILEDLRNWDFFYSITDFSKNNCSRKWISESCKQVLLRFGEISLYSEILCEIYWQYIEYTLNNVAAVWRQM